MAKKPKKVNNSKSVTVSSGSKKSQSKEINELEIEINKKLDELKSHRDGRKCYPLLLYGTSIGDKVVEDIFDELRKNYNDCNGKLDVIIHSGGGDIDAAYNLALLFRKFATSDLTFIIPRWAKSAATLLVCAGNKILMSPIAELGPVDPQITEVNPLEQRMEKFSPLHIEATLSLIRDEFESGNAKLAQGLLQRLQFPLTLGSFKKSLDIGKEYIKRLLSTRMLKGKEAEAKKIAETLTEGYADHGFCINVDEAKTIGLIAEELELPQLDIIWNIHRLSRKKEEIKAKQKRKAMEELIKNMPPELRDMLPDTFKSPLSTIGLPSDTISSPEERSNV